MWNFDTTIPLNFHNSVMTKETSSWNYDLPRNAEARKKLITRKVTGVAGATHMVRRSHRKIKSKGKYQLP